MIDHKIYPSELPVFDMLIRIKRPLEFIWHNLKICFSAQIVEDDSFDVIAFTMEDIQNRLEGIIRDTIAERPCRTGKTKMCDNWVDFIGGHNGT